MTKDVTGTIDTRPLAVPHGEDAIVLALAAQFRLLRAPHRGCGKILVDSALKADVALVEKWRGAKKLVVETAQWRTAIAADEPRRIEPVAAIEFLLHQA